MKQRAAAETHTCKHTHMQGAEWGTGGLGTSFGGVGKLAAHLLRASASL